MINRTLVVAGAVCATLTLSGCEQVRGLIGGGGEPKGQVVATVDGEEITALELRAELGNFSARDPAVIKAAQQQALQRIILRKLLAKAARDEKLDKSSDYTIQVGRGQETLLAQLYQRKLASKVAQPTEAEITAFITDNPNQFENRKVLFVDQVIAAPNQIPPEQLRPLKSLAEVKALLDREGIRYQDNAVALDTLTANPALVRGVMGLPPGEVFVIPQGGALLFNHVASSRDAPLRGDAAKAYATNMLRQQKAGQTVQKQVESLRKAAEDKIQYNAAYKPAPEKKPAAAPEKKTPATEEGASAAPGTAATPSP
ncbi:hypothetical protein [Phenylobacterium sp.]|uniref:hypothetical protein n=1 Tax=Phenylobacterium sp. TaxID=1871053 RepID=UPI00301DBE4B